MNEVAAIAPRLNRNSLQPNQVHAAYEWRRSELIPSLNVVMEEYRHRATGAMHYHLRSDNPENVFLVAFRTVPMDSTGVAHILEHTSLCGSEKYPVRDPFFMMIRRSLNTFMNAFTSSDWTAYPFASKNVKDFNNLLAVYLDATFFARLHELDFAQEGHRLEFAEPEDVDSALTYKGVVFNEMKGAMSSTNSVLWHTMCKYLFPTTTYHYNSGGEPEHIPDLTYQQLRDFYSTHYHPSNAVFMTYGTIPAHEHHEKIESLALCRFKQLDVRIAVPDEKRYFSPIRVEESYAVEQAAPNKTHVVVGWLLGHSTNLDELFKAQLVSSVLLDNSACPLIKALETSDLGSSPSPMCGLEDSNREMSFMAGLEGCSADSAQSVEKLILDTLQDVVKTGIPRDQVEAALHQLELQQREISGDSYPFGLQLILASLSTAMHRGDPIKLLNIDPVLASLREQIKDDRFIPDLIQELILDNPHRVTLSLNPDPELAARKAQAEIQQLAAINRSLSAEDKAEIVKRTRQLNARQAQIDSPEILPKVGLDDVPEKLAEPERIDLQLKRARMPVSFYAQGTNGLCYQQLVMGLPALEQELLDVLPLYTSCLTELGVGNRDYSEVQTWQARISGGLSCFSSIRSTLNDVQKTHATLTFSSKSLADNHHAMTELLHETCHAVRFDESQRLQELIEQMCARKENSITGNGHSLAMNLASSRMSPTAQLAHRFGGLEGIGRLKAWRDQMVAGGSAAMLEQFESLHAKIMASDKQFLIVAEEPFKDRTLDDLDRFWGNNRHVQAEPARLHLPQIRERVCQGWTTSTQVNFCAKAYATAPSGHEDNAVLHVLAGFLRNGYLHRAIREQGGAYGAGSNQDGNSASFRFFSYRDPRLEATLEDFDRSLDWVMTGTHKDNQIEEAILGVIATMDKPSSPAGEAKQAFYNHLFGRTLESRMAFRRRVLETTLADLRAVTERYFDPASASIGIIASQETLEKTTISGIEIINI